MTRSEIENEYATQNGVITSPGKFEGEPVYSPYFYDALLNGEADADDGEVAEFEVTADDKANFPELADVPRVYLWASESGFVYCYLTRPVEVVSREDTELA